MKVLVFIAGLSLYLPSSIFWQGRIGDYDVHWSKSAIQARSHETKVLDVTEWSRAEWQSFVKEAHDRYYEADYSFSLESAVGSIVTVKIYEACDCGGVHSTEKTQFKAFDLAKSSPTKPALAKLTDLFPPNEVLKALMKDPLIRSSFPGLQASSIQEFVVKTRFEKIKTNGSDSCSFMLGTEILSHFAFYDLNANGVSVRLSLSDTSTCPWRDDPNRTCSAGTCKYPAAGSNAKAGKFGFLMRNQTLPDLSGNATTLHFAEPHIQGKL